MKIPRPRRRAPLLVSHADGEYHFLSGKFADVDGRFDRAGLVGIDRDGFRGGGPCVLIPAAFGRAPDADFDGGDIGYGEVLSRLKRDGEGRFDFGFDLLRAEILDGLGNVERGR